MGDVRFEHMSDLDLVVMRADLKKSACPEDAPFLKDIDAELRLRALDAPRAPEEKGQMTP